MQTALPIISSDDLDHVTGGTPSKSPTSGTADTNDQLLTTLQGIQSSLKDLGNNRNTGIFGGNNNVLLFMTMALAMQRRSEVVVYSGGWRGGYSWRSW